MADQLLLALAGLACVQFLALAGTLLQLFIFLVCVKINLFVGGLVCLLVYLKVNVLCSLLLPW